MLDVDIRPGSNSDVQIITLTGEFDLFDQERVENLLFEVVTDDLQGMIFDLTAITYIEEAGFETLMRYLQELTNMGDCMAVIVAPGSRLMKRLERIGFFDAGLKYLIPPKKLKERCKMVGASRSTGKFKTIDSF